MPFAFREDGSKEWCRVWGKCIMLRAVRNVYCPDGDELPEAQLVLSSCVPESYGEYASIIGEHDLDVALCSFVTFAWLRHIVEVDRAPHKRQVTRPRLERTQVSFFIFQSGL